MIRVMVNGARGRMGSEVVKAVSQDADLEFVGGTDREDDLAARIAELKPDVVVDFTIASIGFENAKTIIAAGVSPVIGTSGFQQHQVEELQALAAEQKLGGLIAPNFSLGAVLMMKFSALAAKYLPDVEIIEAHSPQKEESPSGTSIRTAELIAGARVSAATPTSRKELLAGARGASLHDVPVHSVRLPGVVAQQTVFFGGLSETLKIEHNSQHRESFMPGVCLACKKVGSREQLLYGLEHLLD
ncbi:4-hydroxy-tetrahydrodipicolinate reductase [Gynuella sunshinyii]|uniref:4-hydroxy-tetrahydrodipicolinate reductase n=1 Tax=Gynuella sunshinyii YC6258 TaxID=1445510 RepID=A0A0C5VPF8_9GAMM|nr:4-hydroxy-tetrahydrodipicolinate reductase [Gynuella sunshinyii]AJQ92149.1 dihydrodipicolinate reductase [Gynuella sunshinyii YC6258]